jgi:hypothetical protein
VGAAPPAPARPASAPPQAEQKRAPGPYEEPQVEQEGVVNAVTVAGI